MRGQQCLDSIGQGDSIYVKCVANVLLMCC
jgi:hypothetical protein